MNNDNVIRAIHEARRNLSRWNAHTDLDKNQSPYQQKIRELNAELTRRRNEAARAFARLNGWKVRRDADGSKHSLYFRMPGGGKVVVVQEYCDFVEPRSEAVMPPDPFASFWYPGWTTFVVYAHGFKVKWLPEQDGRLAEAGLWLRQATAS
jgi:hypothetical protein